VYVAKDIDEFRCDELLIGDRLVEVNGIKVQALRNDEILLLLRNTTETVTLTVGYDTLDPCKLSA